SPPGCIGHTGHPQSAAPQQRRPAPGRHPRLPTANDETESSPDQMQTPQPLRTSSRVALAVLSALLRAHFLLRVAHRPPSGLQVPDDFTGVGVAPGPDDAHDALQLDHLARLGVRRVRIDFTYGDADGPAGRLLPKLAAAGYRIDLHLL